MRPLKKGVVALPYMPVVSIATGWKWKLLWRSWYFIFIHILEQLKQLCFNYHMAVVNIVIT